VTLLEAWPPLEPEEPVVVPEPEEPVVAPEPEEPVVAPDDVPEAELLPAPALD
jgi:hypothetical protein